MYDGEAIGRMRKLHGIQDGGANIRTFSSDGLMRLMRQTADRDENVTFRKLLATQIVSSLCLLNHRRNVNVMIFRLYEGCNEICGIWIVIPPWNSWGRGRGRVVIKWIQETLDFSMPRTFQPSSSFSFPQRCTERL